MQDNVISRHVRAIHENLKRIESLLKYNGPDGALLENLTLIENSIQIMRESIKAKTHR